MLGIEDPGTQELFRRDGGVFCKYQRRSELGDIVNDSPTESAFITVRADGDSRFELG